MLRCPGCGHGLRNSVPLKKVAQRRQRLHIPSSLHLCSLTFVYELPMPISNFQNCFPSSLWMWWGKISNLLVSKPSPTEMVPFRGLTTPLCVHRLRNVSVKISQTLMTTEHENRNANVTLWVRGKACPVYCGQEVFGLIEMYAYSTADATGGCSHSQHSEIAQELESLFSVFCFERQLDILIMSCKYIPSHNANDYSDSQVKSHIS